ncbi:MAG: TetR/AcrR family transcriptional regulator [Treponema sp.]|jgi:AcrR family transcriptional regulator|nr:TetR/AcrR family transcriptional regulator [Treponema sp.]
MTKTEIVRAAFKVWGRSLYQDTSLSRLAGELKVSKPALYRHFLSKQVLMDAMIARFFDDLADFIRADYERAAQSRDWNRGVSIILRTVAEFYARNAEAMIFFLMNVYGRDTDDFSSKEHLRSRGVDMGLFQHVVKAEYATEPLLLQLLFATLAFFMADFHKIAQYSGAPPSEEDIQKVIALVSEIIMSGLGQGGEAIDGLDYGKLENRVTGMAQNGEDDPLLRAVAEAVAEAGPWKASMDMVARRSGLSKSSLYGHFKNKQDMLRQLFMTEFRRIIAFARQGIALSAVPQEQLYLGIFSIAVYLRSRPEILVAVDWIRTRRLDLGRHEKKQSDFFSVFKDVAIGTLPGGENPECGEGKRQVSHWILFLLVSILMRRDKGRSLGNVRNSDIRTLYRFVTMGLEGFKKC